MRIGLAVFVAVVCASCALASSSTTLVRHKRQMPSLSPFVVNMALRDRNLMRRQISCMLHEGPCDNIGRQLVRMGPHLLRGQCPGCDRRQQQTSVKVMRHVQENYPREYSRLYKMYVGG